MRELDNGSLDLMRQLAGSFLTEEQMDQPASPLEWRRWYKRAVQVLQQHGIETEADAEAGADRCVEMRYRCNHIVVAFAKYNDVGSYKLCETSRALSGLPISLMTETVQKLGSGTNTSAAAWFAEAIAPERPL
ncbi:MAG: hypothetical protein ACFB5Z_19685 [Elainellaceae cyanobacterium]